MLIKELFDVDGWFFMMRQSRAFNKKIKKRHFYDINVV